MKNYVMDSHIFGFSQHSDQLVCFNILPMSVFNSKTHNL